MAASIVHPFPVACTFVAYKFGFDTTIELTPKSRVLCCFLIALTGCLTVPWLRFNERWRMWNRARTAISRLSGFADRLENDHDIENELKAAEYKCVAPWKAWHPSDEEYKNNAAWSSLMPVFYSNPVDSIAILQMIPIHIFLLRRNPAEIESFGETLPFDGPAGTKYKIVSSGRIFRARGWWYVNAEPQM